MIRRILGRLKRMLRPAPAPPAAITPGGPPVGELLRLTDDHGHPNINDLWRATKDLEGLRLNVKMLGYMLAGSLEPRLQAIPVEPQDGFVLDSKACTQGDIETRWFRYWCEQVGQRPQYHRSLWEYAYLLQGLNAAGAMRPGARGLCLGAAHHPAPSYLASKGCDVTIVHDAADAVPEGRRDPLWNEGLVEAASFDRLVRRRTARLSALPADLRDFDVAWSIGTLQTQGSITAGMALVKDSMATLKPGGLAVHIFEYNFADDERTIDNWPLVLFQRRHIQAMVDALARDGHDASPTDFNAGFQEMDRFVDIPPFDTDRTPAFDRLWRDGWQRAHLKVMVDGFICTSFGLIVRKGR